MKEIYQLLSGSLGQEVRLTQIANNLANINTAGFKKDGSVFQGFLRTSIAGSQGIQGSGQPGQQENPADPVWPTLWTGYIDFTPGMLQKTGLPLDVAIEGNGFFRVQVAGDNATYLTRAGNFNVNSQSELVTPSGQRVLDPSGTPIKLDLRSGKPEISEEGTIRIKGATVATLGVVQVANPQQLEKYGEGLFKVPAGMVPKSADAPKLRQGVLEGSNVNAINEMISMIQLQRVDETHQKVMQTFDELTAKRIETAT